MTFTARFIVDDEDALDEAATLRVTLRPLSTGEEQIVELDVERFADLISAPGDLFERTQAISDFAIAKSLMAWVRSKRSPGALMRSAKRSTSNSTICSSPVESGRKVTLKVAASSKASSSSTIKRAVKVISSR